MHNNNNNNNSENDSDFNNDEGFNSQTILDYKNKNVRKIIKFIYVLLF